MMPHDKVCGICIHYNVNECYVEPPQLTRQATDGDAFHMIQVYEWGRPTVYTNDQACSRFDDGERNGNGEQGVPPNPRQRAIQL